jgi:tetratricopeptide (TPR) repeat protein
MPENSTTLMEADEAVEQQEVTLEEALDLAKGHHMAGNYVLADRTYRDILRAVPEHFPTTHLLGVLLYQTGNLEESLSFLEMACKSEEADKQCWNNLGAVKTDLGQYEEAKEAYKKALSLDPDFTEALNNKALNYWFLEEYEEAEKAAKKSLETSADNLDGLVSLGMAVASQGRNEQALETWKKAADKYPEAAKVYNNWAKTLRDVGRHAESEAKCRKALELEPDNPETLNNLGNVLRDRGQVEEAIECYKKATNIQPEHFHAHNNMAIALCDQSRFEEAAISARYAAAFKKDYAPAYGTLSVALRNMGEHAMARAAAQRAVYLEPDVAEHYLDLADANLMADMLDDGEAALQEAIKRKPDSPRAYKKLADIREQMTNLKGAIEAIDKAIKIAPDMPLLWLRKGQILQMDNLVEQAFECVDKAISMAPKWPMALQAKAEMLISVNENEQAEKLVREVLSINETLPGPYNTLTSIKKFKSEDDEDFQKMLSLVADEKTKGLGNASVLNYALSDAYEQMGEYDKAFEHLKKANDYKRKMIPYDPERAQDLVEVIKAKFNPEFFEAVQGKGYESDIPVFIVGMPRSGTTLTEQIISSHPDVFGAGELTEISHIRQDLGGLDLDNVSELGEEYVNRIKKRDKSGRALRITDKMPGNYMNIGLIACILPQAKIIHCRRNPGDTCLSCYKQNFASGQYWSYSLEELAAEYNRYLDIMDYWRRLLPGRFIDIDYEQTVGDFENQARRLVDYIGLEWDDACLEPHKHKRMVLTASKAQVTKPVYKSSVEKWRRYEAHLKPLMDNIDMDMYEKSKSA